MDSLQGMRLAASYHMVTLTAQSFQAAVNSLLFPRCLSIHLGESKPTQPPVPEREGEDARVVRPSSRFQLALHSSRILRENEADHGRRIHTDYDSVEPAEFRHFLLGGPLLA